MRIVLVHALRQSIDPIIDALARHWPEAEAVNLLDDSLATDLERAGAIASEMTARLLALTRYAASINPAAILFTSSAFGPCIEICARALAPLPVLKPYQGMIEEAGAVGGRIGLLATYAPTLASLPGEFREAAPEVEVVPMFVEGALEALVDGNAAEHDHLVVQAAAALGEVRAVALAQFSLARAGPAIAAATGRQVLTAPDSAVLKLKRMLTSDLQSSSSSEAAPS